MKKQSTTLTEVPIQDLGRFTLVAVYNHNGQKLYNKTVDKPLPSKKHNERIIAAQEPKIEPFTDKEKAQFAQSRRRRSKNSSHASFTDDQVREIRVMHSKGVSNKNIAAMYDVHAYTIGKIIKGETYKGVN